jgi:hypothetical protein
MTLPIMTPPIILNERSFSKLLETGKERGASCRLHQRLGELEPLPSASSTKKIPFEEQAISRGQRPPPKIIVDEFILDAE